MIPKIFFQFILLEPYSDIFQLKQPFKDPKFYPFGPSLLFDRQNLCISGSPRRRSARLCASPAPDYVPVPAKRRRSTSSTSSMAEETKAVIQRIPIRKNDLPEKIEEEVEPEKVKNQEEVKTVAKAARTRRTSQIIESSQERELTPVRVTRSRRSSQNFEALKDDNPPASPARVTRSRRSSQNFEPLKEVDESEAVTGKRTRAKKPEEETIEEEEVDEIEESSNEKKSGNDDVALTANEEKREELLAVSKSLEMIIAKAAVLPKSDDEQGTPDDAVDSRIDVEMEEELVADKTTTELDLSDAKCSSEDQSSKNAIEADQDNDSDDVEIVEVVAAKSSAQIAASTSPTKASKKIFDDDVIDVVTIDDKSPVKNDNTSKSKEAQQSAVVELIVETPKKSESPTKKAENVAPESIEVEVGAERASVELRVETPQKSDSPKKNVENVAPESIEVEVGAERASVETPKKSDSPKKNVENVAPESMEVEVGAERASVDVVEVAETEKCLPEQVAEITKFEDKENENLVAEKQMTTDKPISKHSENMKLGRRASGRFWKSERDRFRSTIKSKGLKLVRPLICLL